MGGQFFSLEDIWQHLETFWIIMTEGMLLASSKYGPGMLLNITQYTGQPAQQRITQPKTAMVLRMWKPGPGLCYSKCVPWTGNSSVTRKLARNE